MLKLHIKRDNINANINIVILKKWVKQPDCLVKWETIFILLCKKHKYKFFIIPLQGMSVHIKISQKISKIVKRAV